MVHHWSLNHPIHLLMGLLCRKYILYLLVHRLYRISWVHNCCWIRRTNFLLLYTWVYTRNLNWIQIRSAYLQILEIHRLLRYSKWLMLDLRCVLLFEVRNLRLNVRILRFSYFFFKLFKIYWTSFPLEHLISLTVTCLPVMLHNVFSCWIVNAQLLGCIFYRHTLV